MTCKLEAEVVRAVREGSIAPELVKHQQACADCREAARVVLALRADAGALEASFVPAPVAMVWAAAERSRRAGALARANLCVRILKVSGFVYALLFALWAAHALAGLHGGVALPGLDGKMLTESVAGIAFVAACVGIGLVFELRGERRGLRG
jgi:hypothetical protein